MTDICSTDSCELTSSSHPSGDGGQVLKQADTFAVFGRMGQISSCQSGDQGLFHLGTRHLSAWELSVGGHRPMVLNSTMKQDNSLLVVQMTTPDIRLDDETMLPHGTLHVFRSLIVHESTFYEHCRLTNYSRRPLELTLEYRYDADFRDIFEVRGAHRSQRGSLFAPQADGDSAVLGYQGLDGQTRKTMIEFDGEIESLQTDHCLLRLRLDVGEERTIHATVHCSDRPHPREVKNQAAAIAETTARLQREAERSTVVFTSNEQFNEWIDRSVADLRMLVTETDYGSYPYAGVPWFATPFGRDGLITALETLWMDPQLSRGVLSFLAATQATDVDPVSEAEPGKIIHEMREGEMAALGEVPFRRYYGTVDATPLFVMLAGQYHRRTGDRGFIESIWPNIRRAVRWIDDFGDYDGDGFVEYASHNERGLVHQCWKDSDDSIFHADGTDATGPIAASEVQGYVYQAKQLAAELADVMGEASWAEKLRRESEQLRSAFHEAFWVDEIQTYAIALDGQKRPCAVHNSNIGHLLYTGIVPSDFAEPVCLALTAESTFNGWGIRTISEGEVRYNPMSYHNGSVWPHDTAIGIAGLCRYGFREQAMEIATGLFSASLFNELHRLPELFCGFDRMTGHAPTLYPVACSPQAWAAGAVFLILQSILGLSFASTKPHVRFDSPQLPPYLNWVRIQNLRVGNGVVDLALRRHPRDVGMNVERKRGDIQIVITG
ncbi:amylo-alpha-1,6-glucosidase [Roseiconus nitratireducens]|uniref:Amylo-alpha-1,6-glucosidase n=1 Tax=Roseiconus nitratireducens TaxID=2605748 RepID=A0A5M6D6N3_9BACT|nr:amylo-alpha-1,6-glucosidase [Roseiconus nitratireducens]KAA5543207.1 amylo-alpha-1,6-glucosidase [Roseiconus nitratireducens]